MVKLGRFAPSIVLAILVCTIAAAVEHFVPPDARAANQSRERRAVVARRFAPARRHTRA